MSIRENLASFRCDLEAAAGRYGRDVSDITVMAVSKTRSVEEIIEARRAGLALFGENRVEEASEKFKRLDASEYPLVLIGHLQSNKVNRIDGRYRAVHSVDSIKLAGKLDRRRESRDRPLEVLLQVNTSGEDAKSGFRDRSEFIESAGEIAEMGHLVLKGVMAMAPFVDDERLVRNCFAECRKWGDDIAGMVDGPLTVSMGMSSDFRWAVAEGSTMLRIGTTLFGARS